MAYAEIPPGETKELLPETVEEDSHHLFVYDNNVLVAHSPSRVWSAGDDVQPGDRVKLNDYRGEAVYVHNPDSNTGNARVRVSETSLGLTYMNRYLQGVVSADSGSKASPATDDYDDTGNSGVDISNGGSETVNLNPPGRADQIAFRVEGTASFDVQVSWANTSKTFSSDSNNVVDEVVPAYTIDSAVDVTITDTSAGSNTVDYDMAVT